MIKHGMYGTRIYRIWSNMKTRCFNKNRDSFYRYGGRGITVCDDWLTFNNFYNWAIQNGYKDNLTLDRINVDGNYEPNNCRFITIQEQQKNRSNLHFLSYNGETMCLRDWARKMGLPRDIIARRLFDGWSVKRALLTKVVGS